MSLAKDKKGLVLGSIIEIIILIVAIGFIGTTMGIALNRVDDKTAEYQCWFFNTLRFGTKVEKGPVEFNVLPKACKIIDKKDDIPSKDYKGHIAGEKEGAQAEIRDLVKKCWWMWLEGRQQNMLDSEFYNLKNGCFICYSFSLDKSAGNISYDEFADSLNKPYAAVDESDRCAPFGEGGRCMAECRANSDYFSKEVISSKCEKGLKCCVADNSMNKCVDKGGACLNPKQAKLESEFTELYYNDKWGCRLGSCYVKKKNMASYYDYLQGTKGVGVGAGKVLVAAAADEDFRSGFKYAITFVSPGKNFNLEAASGTAATGLGLFILGQAGIAIVSGGFTIPLQIATAVVGGTTALAAWKTADSGTIRDINYIMISKYDTVSKKCAIEPGVGAKS